MAEIDRPKVSMITVSEDESGQRLDNFLMRRLSGVPKTRLYKAMRKGEVRVNKGRCKPELRIEAGDVIRIPPIQVEEKPATKTVPNFWIDQIRRSILLNTKELLVVNKPTGLAVHGGSGVNVGLIESLRVMFPEQRYLELVHRLDRDTSGIILLAKRAAVLRELHDQLRSKTVDKRYLALVEGRWPSHLKRVEAPLEKISLSSGERIVKVTADGKRSQTDFRVVERFKGATLVEARPVTGRTHQIRVHAQHAGFPILGDAKYAPESAEMLARQIGLKRLFLHAAHLSVMIAGKRYTFDAPLDEALSGACEALRALELAS